MSNRSGHVAMEHNSYPDSNRSMIVFYKQYTSDKYFKIQPT